MGTYIGTGIGVGNLVISGWTRQSDVTLLAKLLFWGKYSDISGGHMPNKITGATDYLTITGSTGEENYACPNNASYIAADTDYIWFNDTAKVTTANLISYDFARTLVKYDNAAPYQIREIIILKSGEVLTAAEDNHLRDYLDLSIYYSGPLSLYGSLKQNRSASNDFILSKTGDGTGVATISLWTTVNMTATLDGSAKFYSDAAGTLGESASWAIVKGGNRRMYIRCPSGNSNLVIPKYKISRLSDWASLANAPRLYGDISNLSSLYNARPDAGNYLTGSIEFLSSLSSFAIYGTHTVIFPNVRKLKDLSNLYTNGSIQLTVENVNQLLADFWYNKDAAKTIATRSIDIRAGALSGVPTGQGAIDKAALQAYRTPTPPGTASLWTVLTKV